MTSYPRIHPTHPVFKRNKISIGAVATAINYSHSHISKVLTGVSRPSAAVDAALYRYARQIDPSFSPETV